MLRTEQELDLIKVIRSDDIIVTPSEQYSHLYDVWKRAVGQRSAGRKFISCRHIKKQLDHAHITVARFQARNYINLNSQSTKPKTIRRRPPYIMPINAPTTAIAINITGWSRICNTSFSVENRIYPYSMGIAGTSMTATLE